MTHPTEYGDVTAPDATVIDLAAFMPPEALDRVEAAAREAAHVTPAGVADLSTGTVRLPDVDGGVLEQLDDDQDQAAAVEALPPVVPPTFTDPAVWRHRRAVVSHALRFHAVRSPLYAGRALRVAAVGARVATRDAWSYLVAAEYGELIDQVRRKDVGPEHIADLRADRRKVAAERRREPLVVYTATGVTTYAAALVALGQAWSAALLAPALLPVFVVLYALGRRELTRRAGDVAPALVFTEAAALDAAAPLNGDAITDALRRAGVLKGDQAVTLVGMPRAVEISATEAVVDLPDGMTVADLVKARDKIAAAFRVDSTWVDFREAGHPGRCRIWLATEDPFGALRTSPLLDSPEQTDVWHRGVPIGYNRRGETVHIKLRHVMALLGGMSRTGKGMLLRNIVCGLGLDPRVNLRLVAGAKPGEHRGYAPVCATFFGRRPERLVALLDALLAEAYRREEYLEDQGRAKLGEADLDEFPLEIVIIDEYKQYATSSARIPDPADPEGKRVIKAADRIAEQLEELAAFAAALNITVLVSTQDPDANTIPRGYKSNSGARVATRTGGPTQTNAILKEGATGAGLRAHDIPEDLKGAAIVDIDGAPGELIRGFFIEDEEYDGAASLIAAGRALREELGRAPGQFEDPVEAQLVAVTGETSVAGGPTGSGRPGAPDCDQAPGARGILAELLDVFAAAGNPDRMRTAELLAGLAERDPDTWSAEALGVDPEDAAGYGRVGGRRLADAIAEALDGTGRTLVTREWTAGGRGRGYVLADVREAAGIAQK